MSTRPSSRTTGACCRRGSTISAPDAVVLHGDLPFFTRGRRRVDVPFAPRSVKDLVESVGVPHPEVGALLVDGHGVGFAHPIAPGAVVEVHPLPGLPDAPPLRPPAPDRFVLDVHLGRLARRLRLLGFDVRYATDADDAQLAEVAAGEDRILLTRDRGLLKRREVVHGHCPRSDDAEEQALDVVARFRLAERVAPFTRCPRCGAPLLDVPKADVLDELPPRTRVEHDEFARCAGCGHLYWPGSHVERVAGFVTRARTAR